MATHPIKTTVIRIKIADTWVTKNLWWPDDKSDLLAGKLFRVLQSTLWFLGALPEVSENLAEKS